MSTVMRLPGSVAEIEASPQGKQVGAFIDLDGTLIAGYSARHLAEQQVRDGDFGPVQLLRTLGVVITGGGLTPETFARTMEVGAQGWCGRAIEDLDEMGERLFRKKIADLMYPEMREIVRAHQARGHTVVLSSSATSFQVEPVARYLGIDNVLCNRFVTEDGLLTGEVVRPVLWGPGKANVVQSFATEHGIDLSRSYFYADGDEDVALMYLVGHPRPTNPGRKLDSVAKRRGWPVLRFASRGRGSMVRTIVGMGSMVPIAGAATAVGLVRRDKRAGVNLLTGTWLPATLRLNRVKLNILDEDNAWKQRPAVFIFNHRNNFDGLIAGAIVKRDFTGVAKGELRSNPLMGPVGWLMDIAFVDRSDSKSSVEALAPLQELATKGLSIILAPEGTRIDTREVGPFKKGAFRIAMAAGIPIVPIVIRNAENLGGRNASTINPGTIDVAVLPPIPVDDWTLEELDERIAEVRQMFLDTLADWPTGT
jgi:putative phosphoserine phosphatase / 1-acylglycerol-3-phosphate O-acyltransferase